MTSLGIRAIVSVNHLAEQKLPKSSFQKGCDVAVPELLIMTVVKIGGEAYRVEIER